MHPTLQCMLMCRGIADESMVTRAHSVLSGIAQEVRVGETEPMAQGSVVALDTSSQRRQG